MSTYQSVQDLDFELTELPTLPPFGSLLMGDPADFDVEYAINPHMRNEAGELHSVDRARALEQWNGLRACFEELGMDVAVLPPLTEHPDLVFCANPGLPIPAEVAGAPPRLVPSRMASEKRQGEVAHLAAFFEARGWRIEPLEDEAERFEGTGDGLWHPGRRLLWGGIGPRSTREPWEEIARRYTLPIVTLELADPDFYHLDTCLALIDESTCLWIPDAFDQAGRELIRRLVPDPIAVSEHEARRGFACNAFAPHPSGAAAETKPTVVIQRGSAEIVRALRDRGFPVREVETGEYVKSGGSVFCMKLAYV